MRIIPPIPGSKKSTPTSIRATALMLVAFVSLTFSLRSSTAHASPRQDDSAPPTAVLMLPPSDGSTLTGQTLQAALSLQNLPTDGLQQLNLSCAYDPSLASLGSFNAGALFGSEEDSNFEMVSGSFTYDISGETAPSSAGSLLQFKITTLKPGTFTLDCSISASASGQTLALPYLAPTLTILNSTGNLASTVNAPGKISIRLSDGVQFDQTYPTAADGSFWLSLPAAQYTLTASAPGCLNASTQVTIQAGLDLTLPGASLICGDVDGSGTIDRADINLIGQYYNSTYQPQGLQPDLNLDGSINLLDLLIIASHFGQTTPTIWH